MSFDPSSIEPEGVSASRDMATHGKTSMFLERLTLCSICDDPLAAPSGGWFSRLVLNICAVPVAIPPGCAQQMIVTRGVSPCLHWLRVVELWGDLCRTHAIASAVFAIIGCKTILRRFCHHCSYAAAGWTLADIDSLGRCLLGRGNTRSENWEPWKCKHKEKPANDDVFRWLSLTPVGGGC